MYNYSELMIRSCMHPVTFTLLVTLQKTCMVKNLKNPSSHTSMS